MRSNPIDSSFLETECLYGETVEILDENSDWFYCRLLTDNYCGWIKKNSLGQLRKPTHRVIVNRSFIFKNKDAKSNCIHYLPMGAKLYIEKIKSNWAKTFLYSGNNSQVGYIPSKHLVDIDHKVKDWVKIAEQLEGTPYKWGGRDTLGIDCSALLQLCYETFGEILPRNTSDQVKVNKKVINDFNQLDRGKVIFWQGHVGIMTDKLNCIHSNAFHMKTIIEPIKKIIERMNNEDKITKILDFN